MVSESKMKNRKAALYARVSTEDKGQNPEVQLDIVRKMAEIRGYEVYDEYVDYKSGKDANRPEMQRMMADARKHRFDAIMAVRLDRIMRSVVNLHYVVKELRECGVRLVFSDMTLDNDDSPNSTLVFNLISSIAQWEREMICTRTKEGLQHARSNGVKLGRKKKELPINKIARERLSGMSWNAISNDMNIPKATLLGRKEEIKNEMEKIKSNLICSENSETPVN